MSKLKSELTRRIPLGVNRPFLLLRTLESLTVEEQEGLLVALDAVETYMEKRADQGYTFASIDRYLCTNEFLHGDEGRCAGLVRSVLLASRPELREVSVDNGFLKILW